MNLYTDLAAAKDELRRAKDHEQTMRAIAEYTELGGKNADDRKRELAFILSQHAGWRTALADLRDCELAVDRCQAAIDQLEAEQRQREYICRIDQIEVDRDTNRLRERMLRQQLIDTTKAKHEMAELFNT